MKKIPTKEENPNGLHGKYFIQKIKRHPLAGKMKHIDDAGYGSYFPEFVLEPTEDDAEYFVLRLDAGGDDINHIKACRIGIHAYADAIEPFIPQLAKDIRERYPLLPQPQQP